MSFSPESKTRTEGIILRLLPIRQAHQNTLCRAIFGRKFRHISRKKRLRVMRGPQDAPERPNLCPAKVHLQRCKAVYEHFIDDRANIIADRKMSAVVCLLFGRRFLSLMPGIRVVTAGWFKLDPIIHFVDVESSRRFWEMTPDVLRTSCVLNPCNTGTNKATTVLIFLCCLSSCDVSYHRHVPGYSSRAGQQSCSRKKILVR